MSKQKAIKQEKTARGFTLVETLTVVIIVGLLAGLAVLKIADSKELAETNYMKSMTAFMDQKVQIITAQEGSFPTIPEGTPAERLAFVLGEIDNRNMMVLLEGVLGKQQAAQLWASIANLSASGQRGQILEALSKARGSAVSGTPEAKEVLILPAGIIVAPEEPSFVVNDPTNPNYEYHYEGYWKPIEIATGVHNLLSGGFVSETERQLILNNLGVADLDLESFKALLASTSNSAEHATAVEQLLGIINGTTPSDTISPAAAAELLNGMLSHENYDPNTVSLEGLDLSLLTPANQMIAAQNSTLSEAQVDYLLSNLSNDATTRRTMLGNLLTNPSLESDTMASIIDIAGASLLSTDQSYFWNKLKTSTIDADTKQGLMEDYLYKQLSVLGTTYATASTQSNNAASTALSYAINGGVFAGMSMSDKQSAMLQALSFVPTATANGQISALFNNGTVVVNDAIVDFALTKFLQGTERGSAFTTVLAKGANLLTEAEKTSVRNWMGTNPYRTSYNAELYANTDLYGTSESLAWAVQNAVWYGQAANGATGKYALLNPNITSAQVDQLVHAALYDGKTALRSYITQSDAVERLSTMISPAKKAEVLTLAQNNLSNAGYAQFAASMQWDATSTQSLVDLARANPTSQLNAAVLSRLEMTPAQLVSLANNNNLSTIATSLTHVSGNRNFYSAEEMTSSVSALVAAYPEALYQFASYGTGQITDPAKLTALANIIANSPSIGTYNGSISDTMLAAMTPTAKATMEQSFVNSGYQSQALLGRINDLSQQTQNGYVDHIINQYANATEGYYLSSTSLPKSLTTVQAATLLDNTIQRYNTLNTQYGEDRSNHGYEIETQLYNYINVGTALSTTGKMTTQQAVDYINVVSDNSSYVDSSYLWAGNGFYESSNVASNVASSLVAAGEDLTPVVSALVAAKTRADAQSIQDYGYPGEYGTYQEPNSSGGLAIYVALARAGEVTTEQLSYYTGNTAWYNALSLSDKLWLKSQGINAP